MSSNDLTPTHMRETISLADSPISIRPKTNEVIVTVIKSGINKSRTRYYPPEVLQRHAKMFEGTKMYVDHLTPRQERELQGMPRSVRDLVATLKETWWDASTQSVKGRAKVVQDWLMEMVTNDREAIGVSIDALGTSRPGVVEGVRLRVAESFTKARSVDWVSLPGAGGAVDYILEAQSEVDLMALEGLTLDDLKKHRPDLVEQISEAQTETPGTKNDDGGTDDANTLTKDSVAEMITEAVSAATETIKADADKRVAQAEQRTVIRECLSKSGLAEPSQQDIESRFEDRVFEADGDKSAETVCKEAVQAAIDAKKEEIRAYGGAGARISGMGPSAMQEGEQGKTAATPVHDRIMLAVGVKPVETAKDGD